MAWPIGQPRGKKYGGRKKGTPNRRSEDLLETLSMQEYDSAEALVFCYKEAHRIFDLRKKNNDLSGALLALDRMTNVASTLAAFVYPKKKAIDHVMEQPKTFADFMALALSDEDDEEEIQTSVKPGVAG